jgi:hypothetical protein
MASERTTHRNGAKLWKLPTERSAFGPMKRDPHRGVLDHAFMDKSLCPHPPNKQSAAAVASVSQTPSRVVDTPSSSHSKSATGRFAAHSAKASA